MFTRPRICIASLLAFGGGLSVNAWSQDAAPDTTQRVEITGSSIKRIASESALPVQTITAADIKKSGVTSVAELIQNLPAMQGFTSASQSINGLSFGDTTASIHDLGDKYTLVLLNGRRMAPLNTGTTVNLNSLPLAAIERVEVLTDGASALYGADAVAGVVNFILRRDSTEGAFEISGTRPQHPGGAQYNLSLTKGFGELDKQGFNVLLAASFDRQRKLDALQRKFSRSGYVPFDYAGNHYITKLDSGNTVGANVFLNSPGPNYPVDPNDLNGGDSAGGGALNPYLARNGHCANGQLQEGSLCRFDYSATVEDIAASTRASLFGSGRLKLDEKASLFTEVAYSHFYTDPRYAAPAQPLQLTQALYDNDVLPYLSAQTGLAPADVIGVSDPLGNGPQMGLRLIDAGGRQDRYQTDTLHAVLGVDATLGNWDTTAYLTHSQNKFYDKAMSGYMSKDFLYARIADGSYDPLLAAAGESVSLLAPGVLHSTMESKKSTIDLASVRGSTTFGHLAGGDIGLGLGAEFMRQKFIDQPAPIEQGVNPQQPTFTDAIVGGTGGAMPFDSTRKSYGVYGELDLPITREFDFTGSARYDNIAAVHNTLGFNDLKESTGAVTQGKNQSKATFKISARLQPTKEFLVRGSFGTGFKAPTIEDISGPLASGGSTGTQDCPFTPADPRFGSCHNVPFEYNTATKGNPSTGASGLKPERSVQWTTGFRVEPSPTVSFGADLWDVRIFDQIGNIPEDAAFGNAVLYTDLFVIAPDPISGSPTLTFLQVPKNLGTAHNRGIDLDGEGRVTTPFGRLSARAHMTYMLEADYQFTPDGERFSSMDKIGADSKVTFRWIANLSMSLDAGAFTHTLNATFKPGYLDKPGNVVYRNADGTPGADLADGDPLARRRVGNYSTFDWQTRYAVTKDLAVTGGLRNVFDTRPPFTAQDEAATGNARGFDGRYTDPTGRAFYLAASYKF
jgi:iron complex outermembrane receptor protein